MMQQVPDATLHAFESVYSARHREVFAFCYYVLLDRQAAFDAAVQAWRLILATLKPEEETKPNSEVIKAAAASCIALLRARSKSRQPTFDDDPELLDTIDWQTAEIRELAQTAHWERDLRKATATLSPKQRVALMLKYRLGYDIQRIGHVLGCSSGAARTYLRSATLAASRIFNAQEAN